MIPIPAIIAVGKALIGSAIAFVTTQAPLLIKSCVSVLSRNALLLMEAGKFIPKLANIAKTKEINKQLFNLVGNYAKNSKPFEELGKSLLDTYSGTVKKTLNNFSSEYKLPSFLSDTLERKTDSLKSNLSDFYEKEISKSFSLNNESLLNILEKTSSFEKEKELKKFTLESVEKTHANLIKDLKKHSENQQELIKHELKKLKENQFKEAENLQLELDSIKKCYTDEEKIKNKISNLNNVLYKLEKL